MHLVIGASGQVGGALVSAFQAREFPDSSKAFQSSQSSLSSQSDQWCGTYCNNLPPDAESANYRRLDLSSADQIADVISKVQPTHIYLPASYTHVDGCEADPERSLAVNVEAVKNIIAAAGSARLIYFSSDYVFDGKNGPYAESDPTSPISVYGRHKVMAEELVRAASDSLIVRTTVVYGPEWQAKNFVLRLINTLTEGNEIAVPDDQTGTPTYNRDLAVTTLALVDAGISGLINIAGETLCSRYELALAVAFTFALDDNLIVPVTSDMLDQQAARPLKAGLQTGQVRQLLGKKAQLTGFREALDELRISIEF